MKIQYFIFWTCLLLLAVCCLLFIIYRPLENISDKTANTVPIYCLMVTGKDDKRISLYAKAAVQNFLEQDYTNKHLVIINHHKTKNVCTTESLLHMSNIIEIHVEKSNTTTLGDMRNISLELVAEGAYWTTWDDDDYRTPNYLSMLMSFNNGNNVIITTQRLEYNLFTKHGIVAHKHSGFVMFAAPKDSRVMYLQKDSMEDTEIIRKYNQLGYKLSYIKNSPMSYLRLVHDNNTSLYVNPQRQTLIKGIDYYENKATEKEMKYMEDIINKYYV